MKNKAFTLIELLAVVVILGVIMLIAIPNVVSTLDRNKKDSFIEDAKRMITSAEYKMRSDVNINWPKNSSITIIKLSTINSSEVIESPYDTKYSQDNSFVAIKKDAEGEYIYYAHLVACRDELCNNITDETISYNRGINLKPLSYLSSDDRFIAVVSGSEVEIQLINDIARIKSLMEVSVNYTVNLY